MLQYIVKVLVTAIVVVAVAELAKRNSMWAATLASLPLTSLLAFVWLHFDGVGPQRIAVLSTSILWLVLASLVLFVVLPVMLRAGISFWISLAVSCAITAAAYAGVVAVLPKAGARV